LSSMHPCCEHSFRLINITNVYLVEVLLKLGRVIIDVINVNDDVSSCCVPTVKYLYK